MTVYAASLSSGAAPNTVARRVWSSRRKKAGGPPVGKASRLLQLFSDPVQRALLQPGYLRLGYAHLGGHLHLGLPLEKTQS